jgi:hypothetical protein
MSWIDTFLSDGDPHRVLGADARKALSRVARARDLVPLWIGYWKTGLPLGVILLFACLDLVRRHFYAKGFRAGGTYPWGDKP